MKNEIIFLVGPTAVGKTEVSLHLSRLMNAEIISCDSMQVYKGMDIGTRKPTPLQRKAVTHYMIDIIGPSRNFSVAEFRKRALGYIDKIHKRGKVPLFVGGTALYMKALIDGLFPSPPADRILRRKLLRQETVNQKGFLHQQLLEVDPRTAKKLHSNDTRRIIRALEVYIKTNTPISESKKKTRGLGDRYNLRIFALNRNRQDLYKRINERIEKMFRQGFMRECRLLKERKLSMTASQALGYKEVFSYLTPRGRITKKTPRGVNCLNSRACLNDIKDLIKKNTRHFAKRQLSWFRNDKRLIWIDVDERQPEEIAKAIYRECTGMSKNT